MGEHDSKGREREKESRRILERLEREQAATEGIIQRSITKTANHLSAQDAPENDRIELWATRVGRMFGLLITLAIIVWLILYLMQSKV